MPPLSRTANHRPSGEKPHTASSPRFQRLLLAGTSSLPQDESCKRMTPSYPPVANTLPSGAKAKAPVIICPTPLEIGTIVLPSGPQAKPVLGSPSSRHTSLPVVTFHTTFADVNFVPSG